MPAREVILRILGDDISAMKAISETLAGADDIEKKDPTLKIGADASGAMGKMAALRSAVAALTDEMNAVKFTLDDAEFDARLAAMRAKLVAFQEIAGRPAYRVSDKMLAQTTADVLSLAAAFDRLTTSRESAAAAALDDAHAEAMDALMIEAAQRNTGHESAVAALPGWKSQQGGGGGFFGLLPGTLPLLGGLGSVSGTHLGLDIATELTASLGSAAVAAAAYGAALAALAPTAAMIYQRETAMYTATDVLGQAFPILTTRLNQFGTQVPVTVTSLNQLNQQFRPGVIQIWGDALTVASQGGGAIQTLLQQVVPWLDKFAARLTVDMTDGSGKFMKFVQDGAHYLGEFGTILGNVGRLLGDFFQISERTHIASDLLGIIGDFTHLAAVILSNPVAAWAATLLVGLHGIYLWGGLALNPVIGLLGALGKIPGLGALKVFQDLPGAFDRLAVKGLEANAGLMMVSTKGFRSTAIAADGTEKEIGRFGTALGALSAIPVWGWVAAGTVALGGLLYWLSRGATATDQFITNINQGIAKASNGQAFNLMAGDIGEVNNQLRIATTASHLNAAASDAASSANMRQGQGMSGVGAAATQAAVNQQKLAAETGKVTTEMTNFGTGAAWIMKTFGVDYPTALEIADQAGVHLTSNMQGNSKAAQELRQQIFGLISGLTQIQGPSDIAGKDFEVLAYASNDITAKIGQLNSAWDAWEKTVTGGQTSFDTFQQGMETLNSQTGNFTLHLGVMSTTGKQSKVAIDALSAAGLNLNQAFMQEVGNAGSVIDALRTQNASVGTLQTSTKAMIVQLLPFAKGSQEATSVLYGLALQADYTGNNSFASLANWAGVKTPGAMKTLKASVDQATTAASNLANTVENLLNVQFQQDIIQSSGASKSLATYTQDLVNNRQQTQQGQTDRQNLINDLIKAGINADKARSFVDGLSTSIGKIPASTVATIKMTGNGYYTITENGVNYQISQGGLNSPHAVGGYIRVGSGPTADDVPIRVSRGEYVVRASSVSKYGKSVMDDINAGRFASGGYVGDIPGLSKFTTGMFSTFQGDMATSMVSAMKGSLTSVANTLAGSPVANVGSGVMRWDSLVRMALAMEGLGQYLASQVEYQMMTESGGNPNAINLTDSNAAAGDPSRGLLQTIMSTFLAYHWPGTSFNIYDPLANLAAAINYARHVYGPTLMSGGRGMGSGHGYANGGIISEPILGIGASGQQYSFGEAGREAVIPLNGTSAAASPGGGSIYVVVNAGDCVDPNAVAQAIHEKLRRYKTKNGGQPLGLG